MGKRRLEVKPDPSDAFIESSKRRADSLRLKDAGGIVRASIKYNVTTAIRDGAVGFVVIENGLSHRRIWSVQLYGRDSFVDTADALVFLDSVMPSSVFGFGVFIFFSWEEVKHIIISKTLLPGTPEDVLYG